MVSVHPQYVPPTEPDPNVVTVTVNVTVIETTSQIQTVIVSDVIDRTATVYVTPTCAVSNVISSVTVTETIDRTQTATVHVTPTCAVSNVISSVTVTETIDHTHTATVHVTPSFAVSYVISSVTVTETIDRTQTVHVTPTCAVSNVIFSVMVTETLTTTTTQAARTHTKNITLDDAAELAEEYRKNLTVDTKTTSSYIRTKTSAEDERKSSQTMGALGLLMVIVPLGAIIILDLPKIWFGLKSYNSVIGMTPAKQVTTVMKYESNL